VLRVEERHPTLPVEAFGLHGAFLSKNLGVLLSELFVSTVIRACAFVDVPYIMYDRTSLVENVLV
jgi:hypothetical protein